MGMLSMRLSMAAVMARAESSKAGFSVASNMVSENSQKTGAPKPAAK